MHSMFPCNHRAFSNVVAHPVIPGRISADCLSVAPFDAQHIGISFHENGRHHELHQFVGGPGFHTRERDRLVGFAAVEETLRLPELVQIEPTLHRAGNHGRSIHLGDACADGSVGDAEVCWSGLGGRRNTQGPWSRSRKAEV